MLVTLRKVPAPTALIAGVVPGFLLIALSWLAGVDSFLYSNDGVVSQRGYISAVNWSVNFLIMLPLLLFFMVVALQRIPPLCEALARARMVVTRTNEPVSEETILGIFDRQFSRATKYLAGFGLLAVVWSAIEWFQTSLGPVVWKRQVPINEIDWAMKAAYDSSANAAANIGFSIIAFVAQAALAFLLIVFIGFVVSFATAVSRLANEYRLKPNLRSEDPRRGFQIFERITVTIMLATLVIYGMFYLTRVWNAYLDPHNGNPTLLDFILGDLIKGFTNGLVTGFGEAFATTHFDQSSGIVTLAAPLIFVLVFVAIAAVLGDAAKGARELVSTELDHAEESASYDGLTVAEARARVKSMVMWPVSYPRPLQLLVFMLFAILCLVFYRLGLVYMGIVFAATLTSVVKVTKRLEGAAAP
ncbi:MAG TPA: hypothetical protein VK864_16585 [Longimicrobiales bacterium]|nr:hypothetical protein [Longimicrobiales bacterium]